MIINLRRDFIACHAFENYQSDDREFNGVNLGPVGSKIRIDFRRHDVETILSHRRRILEITDIDLAKTADFNSVAEVVNLLRMNMLSRYLGEGFKRLKAENEARMNDLG